MTIDLFESLISSNWPNLELKSLEKIDNGEDYNVFDVNNEFIFKTPKSKKVLQKLKFEVSLMPQLSGTLPVLVPEFIFIKSVGPNIKLAGYKKIIGIPFSGSINALNLRNSADKIKESVSVLGSLPLPTGSNIQWLRNKWRRFFQGLLNFIKKKALNFIRKGTATKIVELFLTYEYVFFDFDFQPALIHADWKSDHLLCDNENNIIGVIDWGDSTYGDPAFDLARLLDEFGLDFLMLIVGDFSILNLRRVAFYAIIIPFFKISQGIQLGDNNQLMAGINNLEWNVANYIEIFNIHSG